MCLKEIKSLFILIYTDHKVIKIMLSNVSLIKIGKTKPIVEIYETVWYIEDMIK